MILINFQLSNRLKGFIIKIVRISQFIQVFPYAKQALQQFMSKSIILGLLLATVIMLDVRHCLSEKTFSLNFTYIDGTPDNTTWAELCHNNKELVIRWKSIDKQIISPYNNCNDPLYNADAVQAFIATVDSFPTHYYQFQVSPSSALFFADITNGNGDCSNIPSVFQDCAAVQYSASRTKIGWNAKLIVDLSIIGRGQPLKQFKINLLRIDASSNTPTRYLTWKPTYSNPPCFHVPAVFEMINLV